MVSYGSYCVILAVGSVSRSDAREGADDGADSVAGGQPLADCDFNLAALHPAYPIKCRTST